MGNNNIKSIERIYNFMQKTLSHKQPPSLEDHTLLTTGEHNTRSISPLHVTVIKTLAALIEVDPTEEPLQLANYVSIEALDRLTHHDKKHVDARSAIGFYYTEYTQELFILARSNGDILIYEPAKSDS